MSLRANQTYRIGDNLELMAEMPSSSVDLVVTDPPFNVGMNYGTKFDDRKVPEEYLKWYRARAEEIYRVHKGGYLYVSCSPNQDCEIKPIWLGVGYDWMQMLIWHGKNYATPWLGGNPWRGLFELILMFCKGKVPKPLMLNSYQVKNTDAVLEYARPQTDYTGLKKRMHPTQKPVELYRDIIARSPGKVVFDPFLGSGTVLVACALLGREGLGFEVNPEYEPVIRTRLGKVANVRLDQYRRLR